MFAFSIQIMFTIQRYKLTFSQIRQTFVVSLTNVNVIQRFTQS